LAVRRQDDHRHRRPAADALQHLKPVHIGQAEVEDDPIGGELRRLFDPLLASACLQQPVAVAIQGVRKKRRICASSSMIRI
jgi:hypothetical protein